MKKKLRLLLLAAVSYTACSSLSAQTSTNGHTAPNPNGNAMWNNGICLDTQSEQDFIYIEPNNTGGAGDFLKISLTFPEPVQI